MYFCKKLVMCLIFVDALCILPFHAKNLNKLSVTHDLICVESMSEHSSLINDLLGSELFTSASFLLHLIGNHHNPIKYLSRMTEQKLWG